MIKLITTSAAILAITSTTVLADSPKSVWLSEITCGNTTTYIASKCTKDKENPDFNNCQKPQILSQNKYEALKLIGKEIPDYTSQEKKEYQKADTANSLFAVGWRCINTGSDSILRVYFSTGTGSNKYDEKVEYYNSNGLRINKEEDKAKIRQAEINKQVKDKEIKSIISE